MAIARLDRLICAIEMVIESYLEQEYPKYYKLACSLHSKKRRIYKKTLKLVDQRKERSKHEYYLWFKESFRSSYKYHRCADIEEIIPLLKKLEISQEKIDAHYHRLDKLIRVSDKNIDEVIDHESYVELCRVINEVSTILIKKEREIRHKWTGFSSLAEDINIKILGNNKINIDALNDAFMTEINVKVAMLNKVRTKHYHKKVANPEIEELRKTKIILTQQLEMSVEAASVLQQEVEHCKEAINSMRC